MRGTLQGLDLCFHKSLLNLLLRLLKKVIKNGSWQEAYFQAWHFFFFPAMKDA